MKSITCKKCGKQHIIKEKKPTIYGGLIKWGSYGVAAVFIVHFFAVVLVAMMFFIVEGAFDKDIKEEVKKCSCGEELEDLE